MTPPTGISHPTIPKTTLQHKNYFTTKTDTPRMYQPPLIWSTYYQQSTTMSNLPERPNKPTYYHPMQPQAIPPPKLTMIWDLWACTNWSIMFPYPCPATQVVMPVKTSLLPIWTYPLYSPEPPHTSQPLPFTNPVHPHTSSNTLLYQVHQLTNTTIPDIHLPWATIQKFTPNPCLNR